MKKQLYSSFQIVHSPVAYSIIGYRANDRQIYREKYIHADMQSMLVAYLQIILLAMKYELRQTMIQGMVREDFIEELTFEVRPEGQVWSCGKSRRMFDTERRACT
jgi:hypothetical protein